MNIPERYCMRCGQSLIGIVSTSGYDKYTGKPVEYYAYHCPTIYLDEMIKDPSYYAFDGVRYKGHCVYNEKK